MASNTGDKILPILPILPIFTQLDRTSVKLQGFFKKRHRSLPVCVLKALECFWRATKGHRGRQIPKYIATLNKKAVMCDNVFSTAQGFTVSSREWIKWYDLFISKVSTPFSFLQVSKVEILSQQNLLIEHIGFSVSQFHTNSFFLI